jgi:beta-glucosidase-like glycosyl hydrolase
MGDLAKAPYRDASRSVRERALDLLGRMSRSEKVAQLCSVWLTLDPERGDFAPHQGTFSPGGDVRVELEHGIGQITRPLGSRPIHPREGARALNEFQRRLIEETRLGIPAIAHEESLTGFMTQDATQFPSPLNYGATWDPELIERVGAVIRRQMRAVGTHQALAPVADVIRDARWGRVEECVSEDPYLVGCVVSAYVRGLQGDDLESGIAATLKHFCGYSWSEGGRNFGPAHVGPRELADVFLIPFEMGVKEARVQSVMNAYQDLDGEPAASSRWLLTELLRDRWGFEGIVVSDYFSVKMLEELHQTAEGRAEASAAALSAGLDVELPTYEYYPEGLPAALDAGLIDEATLDVAVERVLRLKLRLGLFENPYVDVDAIELDLPGERALARTVAEESMTLLSNDGTLPLSSGSARVAVIGPNADDAMALFGNYSFQNHIASHFPDHPLPTSAPTVLEAIRERIGEERVTYAEGCQILSEDRSGIEAARTAADAAEVAVVVVGDKAGHFRRGTVGEGTDTDDLSLPGVQQELLDAVIATGTPTVVVLVNGRPPAIPALADEAAAILEAWFPGQDGAAAIAGVLFGDINPGGKTTVSFSQSAGAQPCYYNHKRLAEGVPRLPAFEPVFPFGHGLSYTSFEYSDLRISSSEVPVDGEVEVGCTVRNGGERPGEEVVQLYFHDPVASVTRPVQELLGFARVRLEAGRACRIRFGISADRFSFTGIDHRRRVEPGAIELMIGASSRDIRLEGELRLTGAVRMLGEDRVLRTRVRVEPKT